MHDTTPRPFQGGFYIDDIICNVVYVVSELIFGRRYQTEEIKFSLPCVLMFVLGEAAHLFNYVLDEFVLSVLVAAQINQFFDRG